MTSNAYSAQGAEIAARLREQAARLGTAAEAATEVTAEAACAVGTVGTVSVTATGGGRVRQVTIEPRELRVPPPELGAATARAVNQAVGAARDRAARATDIAAAPSDADAERFTSKLAGERVSASSANRRVTVTASGTGEIAEVLIDASAGPERDGRDLGGDIAEASNGALEAARRLQQRILDSMRHDGGGTAYDRVSQHARQMDELLDRLAEVGRRIDDW